LAQERHSDGVTAGWHCRSGNCRSGTGHGRIANYRINFDADYEPRSNDDTGNGCTNARYGCPCAGNGRADAGNSNPGSGNYARDDSDGPDA